MNCPNCGNPMSQGAPHGEEIKVQYECYGSGGCGNIVTENYTAEEMAAREKAAAGDDAGNRLLFDLGDLSFVELAALHLHFNQFFEDTDAPAWLVEIAQAVEFTFTEKASKFIGARIPSLNQPPPAEGELKSQTPAAGRAWHYTQRGYEPLPPDVEKELRFGTWRNYQPSADKLRHCFFHSRLEAAIGQAFAKSRETGKVFIVEHDARSLNPFAVKCENDIDGTQSLFICRVDAGQRRKRSGIAGRGVGELTSVCSDCGETFSLAAVGGSIGGDRAGKPFAFCPKCSQKKSSRIANILGEPGSEGARRRRENRNAICKKCGAPVAIGINGRWRGDDMPGIEAICNECDFFVSDVASTIAGAGDTSGKAPRAFDTLKFLGGIFDRASYNIALDLLQRATALMENGAPDPKWFHDYFSLTGQFMILDIVEKAQESADASGVKFHVVWSSKDGLHVLADETFELKKAEIRDWELLRIATCYPPAGKAPAPADVRTCAFCQADVSSGAVVDLKNYFCSTEHQTRFYQAADLE